MTIAVRIPGSTCCPRARLALLNKFQVWSRETIIKLHPFCMDIDNCVAHVRVKPVGLEMPGTRYLQYDK